MRLALCALLLLAALSTPAAAQDANLEQRIVPGQSIAPDRRVIATGHADIGPRFVDDAWTLMVHDDTAKAGGGASVWRRADRTVLRVADAARRRVPDDPAYDFLRLAPGTEAFVVPQTQDPDVVWLGWNTQDPEVIDTIDRGVTMALDGVEGPGDLVVYLQSGTFDDPEVLWDSAGGSEPVFVDVNTHTHANWVFSDPGVYLVRITLRADLVDGTTVTDTRDLRFAVGTSTPVADAFRATWRGPDAARPAEAGAAADDGAPAGGSDTAVLVAAAAAAALLAAGLAAAVVRGRRAKREARAGGA